MEREEMEDGVVLCLSALVLFVCLSALALALYLVFNAWVLQTR
jgi:hypothetical protein